MAEAASPSKRPRVTKAKEPSRWQEVYEKIRAQRLVTPAPVDTMGCDRLALKTAPAHQQRLHHLVSVMLSSQTKDQLTAAAVGRLHDRGLTVDMLLEISHDDLAEIIKPVGFFNRKAIYLKQMAQTLRDQYNDDIPDTLEGLMSLPGVGPKMAHLCMQSAWDKTVGIGVDVHVHRISNRLGWVKTTTPEATRMALEEWLPRDYWRHVNPMLVGFGQTVCLPVKPRCEACDVRDICPSSTVKRKGPRRAIEPNSS